MQSSMKWQFVYNTNEFLGEQWRLRFGGQADVEILAGDICWVRTDAIVSPANSFGFMDGGLDQALSERFGWELQEILQRTIADRPLKELLVGEALVLPTGDPDTPWLISAPTMRVPMRLRQSVNAYLAMKAILVTALSHAGTPPIRSVAIPGLGTGVGALDAETSALQMWMAYREVVLQQWHYPEDFGEAQKAHLGLNVKEIRIWD
jgi:O-acetyl-ADP-ribose deacetylase (regulator of RNase III)